MKPEIIVRDGVCRAVQEGGRTLAWSESSGVKLIERDGLYFKDLARCGELLRARPGVTEKNPASARLGVTAHCDNMVVTSVEIVEQMLEEEKAEQ